jgi:hypothetical protein
VIETRLRSTSKTSGFPATPVSTPLLLTLTVTVPTSAVGTEHTTAVEDR